MVPAAHDRKCSSRQARKRGDIGCRHENLLMRSWVGGVVELFQKITGRRLEKLTAGNYLSDADMVTVLYRAFLGRDPDASALAYHCRTLAEGEFDARSLIALFLNCDEYRQRSTVIPPWVPPGHYYSPIVNPTELRADAARVFDRSRRPAGIDLNEEGQVSLVPILRNLAEKLPFKNMKQEGLFYYSENSFYNHGDGIVLASMMLHLRPRRILEFGSGFSSCVMLDMNRLFFEGQIECTFVDPYPQRLRELLHDYDGPVRILESRAQDIDLDLVRELQKDDILFIDSTHVSKAGSDVNFHFFDVLPALKPGVVIHIHDVTYPFEYSEEWFFNENRSWNESYLLRGFLMYNSAYRIEFFNSFMYYEHRDLARTIPFFERNPGCAIWLRKM
jgi:hypothetical protein